MKKVYFRTYFLLFSWLIAGHALNAQTAGDYRSAASGAWSTIATWETYNGTAWIAAIAAPTSANGIITIQSAHTVTITAAVTIDQVVINSGAMLNWTLGTCTFANGAGVDLQVDGSFWDNRGVAATSITFNAGATWIMGANGTLIRSAGNSSNNWQSAYQSGIANIPSTANWILRKTGTQTPALSSTTPATGSVYPNLMIENLAATAFGLSFTGSGAPQTIKGNLDIGGTGAGTGVITFTNTNTNATTTLIQGNVTVRNTGATHSYLNNGTGTTVQGNMTVNGNLSNNTVINLQGDLQVNGSMNYSGVTSTLNFTGSTAQGISGPGTLQMYKASINKSSNNVTLNRAIIIDNTLTLTLGKLISTSSNLVTIGANGTAVVTSPTTNNSFVSGPIRKDGTHSGFTFPVGKGTNYQPLGVSVTTGISFGTFWTENFSTNAAGWNLASVQGAEGADPNFFVSNDNEGGVAPGGCGVASNGNNTLHVTSVFSPSGGAAYDAGGLCGFLFCPQTNRRAESPTIDCSGKTNTTINFNYIEGGSGTNDDATLWYFDGATWAQIDNMPKTATGCGGQGIWTARSVLLPASSYNNPNIKIGFRWVNNDDGAGTDPSFAVDEITIAENAPLEAFTCEYFAANPQIDWGTAKDATILDITPVEYWVLDRNVGTANKQVTLAWDNASGIVAPAATQVIKWDGTQWKDHTNGGTSGVSSIDPTCTSQSSCGDITSGTIVTSFSPFTFGIPVITPLPIELLDFAGALEQDQTHLKWSTASEKNNSYFLIEKSNDGVNFTELGKVTAAGNSSSVKNYQLYDNKLQEGISYYRLKSIDLDQSFKYSNTVSVDYALNAKNILLYPNPTNSKLYLNIADIAHKVTEVKVMDITGVLLNTKVLQSGNNTYEVSLENYSNGIYFIEFIYSNKKHTEKVIKE